MYAIRSYYEHEPCTLAGETGLRLEDRADGCGGVRAALGLCAADGAAPPFQPAGGIPAGECGAEGIV